MPHAFPASQPPSGSCTLYCPGNRTRLCQDPLQVQLPWADLNFRVHSSAWAAQQQQQQQQLQFGSLPAGPFGQFSLGAHMCPMGWPHNRPCILSAGCVLFRMHARARHVLLVCCTKNQQLGSLDLPAALLKAAIFGVEGRVLCQLDAIAYSYSNGCNVVGK